MNIFGLKIESPSIKNQQFLSEVLNKAAKKEDERKLLYSFLFSPSLDGGLRIEEIIKTSQEYVHGLSLDDPTLKSQAFSFLLSQLKSQKTQTGITLYQDLILQLIQKGDGFTHQTFARDQRLGKIIDKIPPSYPGEFKRAQNLIDGQVSSSIGDKEVRQYLLRQHIQSLVLEVAKNLFFAVNRGLDREKVPQFISLVYELNKLKTAPSINEYLTHQAILRSLESSIPLDLIHIKSIRFTYPSGNNLKVLEDTSPATQTGHRGEARVYPSEEAIFTRFESLVNIFKLHGINTHTTLIVSDHDLDYCFPQIQKIVPPDDVLNARDSVIRYLNYLKSSHPEIDSIHSLTGFLVSKGINPKYHQVFDMLVFQGQGGGGQHVSEKILEMRINGQYEHYSQMFKSYTRQLARFTAIRQIANVLALSVIFESFPAPPVLVIDSRGFEDQLIGGLNPKSVGKLFIKLKDSTQIISK